MALSTVSLSRCWLKAAKSFSVFIDFANSSINFGQYQIAFPLLTPFPFNRPTPVRLIQNKQLHNF